MTLLPYLRAARSWDWTDAEVAEAVDFVRRQRPDVWAELERLERTTHDLKVAMTS